jgi:hydrogenase nickel incorporation protein HypB
MCNKCGCDSGPNSENVSHDSPTHPHDHTAAPAQTSAGSATALVKKSLFSKNDRLAAANRERFRGLGLLVLNMLSSPGSGKTTLIQETSRHLAGRLRIGVIVGDLATDNDAARLRAGNVPVVQITTGTVCHLDAAMVAKAANTLDLSSLDVLIIENVGNLVCPAGFDLGEDRRIVLLSTTEGEDKPLKYPLMFHTANVALVTKMDLAEAAGFDRATALSNLRRTSHHADIFELSARGGAGMEAWCNYLIETTRKVTSEKKTINVKQNT